MKSDSATDLTVLESNERAFFERARLALGKSGSGSNSVVTSGDTARPSMDDQGLLERIHTRNEEDNRALLELLKTAGERIGMPVALADPSTAKAEIIGIIRKEIPEWDEQKTVVAWDHPHVKALKLEATLASLKIPLYYGHPPADVNRKAFVGLTSVDFCLADTGTLILRTTAAQPRSTSLLPSIHIAVIRPDQLLANLKELYVLLQKDPAYAPDGLTNCLTMITGPSKTADIEATMVHGAHGPRKVLLFVLNA